MERQHRTLAVCFGAISALGPLAMDMYLAAMPDMAADFGDAGGRIEMSVMAFFVGFCLGQLIVGPMSDRTGRKPVVVGGLIVFLLASVGCALAQSLNGLMAWRFIQGLGGSVGMVLAMAAIRDLFTGAMAAKLLGMVVMVLGLAPVVAPLLGSAILMILPWQAIFWFLAIFATVILLLVLKLMPETRDRELRAQSRPFRALAAYARLLASRNYIPYTGALALAQGGFFGYVAVASVVLISYYGLSTMQFAVIFACNALGLGICANFGGTLTARFGALRVVKLANTGRAVLGVVLAGSALAGPLPLTVFVVLCFLLVASLGFVMPGSSVLAMEHQGKDAGTASSLLGAMGFGGGAVMSAIIGALSDGSASAVSLVLAGTAILAWAVTALFFARENPEGATHSTH